jgi:hypothetical protein
MKKLKTTQGVALFLKLFTIMIMVLACTAGCKKDKNESDDDDPSGRMQDVVLQGIVIDSNNHPLGGVQVKTGSVSKYTTDSDGRFMITEAWVVNKRVVLTFEKENYFNLTRSIVKDDDMFIGAVLYPKGSSAISVQKTFSTETATTLEIGNMKVDLPAAAFMKTDGNDYNGTVKADMLYLNPDNKKFAGMMPGGDLAGVRTNGDESVLISYGMSDLLFTDNNGNPLQIKSGTSAKISFPLPESMKKDPPATMPLWSFDAEKGRWTEEGVFTFEENMYVGTTTHFSWISNSLCASAATIIGKVMDCDNEPIHHIAVRAGQTEVYTNREGKFRGTLPVDTPTTLSVTFNNATKTVSLPGYTVGLTTIPDIQMSCMVKIKGKVIDCDEKPASGVKVSIGTSAEYTDYKGEYLFMIPEDTPVIVKLPGNVDSKSVKGQPNGTTITVRDLKMCGEVQEKFKAEKASIKMMLLEVPVIITWDCYGNRYRMDVFGDNESHSVDIVNHFDRTRFYGVKNYSGIAWLPADYDPKASIAESYSVDEEIHASHRVYPDIIVAGKTCKVFQYETFDEISSIASWNGLLMKNISLGDLILEAVDVTLDIPEEAFTQTFTVSWMP